MTLLLSLEDCFKDSPAFRNKVAETENHLIEVEQCFKIIYKAIKSFLESYDESLSHLGKLESSSAESLPLEEFNTLCDVFSKIILDKRQEYRQLEQSFMGLLENFLKKEFGGQIKELKRKSERSFIEFRHVNSKFMSKCKIEEEDNYQDALFESAQEVAEAKRNYHISSMDYVEKLDELMIKKDSVISEAITCLIHAHLESNKRIEWLLEEVKSQHQPQYHSQQTHQQEQSEKEKEMKTEKEATKSQNIQSKEEKEKEKVLSGLDSLNRLAEYSKFLRVNQAKLVHELEDKKRRIIIKYADLYNPLIVDKTNAAAPTCFFASSSLPNTISNANPLSTISNAAPSPSSSMGMGYASGTEGNSSKITNANSNNISAILPSDSFSFSLDNSFFKSGYLYKKSSHAVRPVWSRRFFEITSNHTLQYYGQDGAVEIDLRLCKVRLAEGVERRFAFEIISPIKTYYLQAENDLDMNEWIESIREASQQAILTSTQRTAMRTMTGSGNATKDFKRGGGAETMTTVTGNNKRGEDCIGTTIHDGSSGSNAQHPFSTTVSFNLPPYDSSFPISLLPPPSSSPSSSSHYNHHHVQDPLAAIESSISESAREELMIIPGNELCADCRSPNPEWASLTFGILVCIECSGIHRSLSIHKSKIKSLRLDFWESEQIELLLELGNAKSWNIFEFTINHSNSLDQGHVQDQDHQEEKKETITTIAPTIINGVRERPTPSSPHSVKEEWILAKYEFLQFLPPIPSSLPSPSSNSSIILPLPLKQAIDSNSPTIVLLSIASNISLIDEAMGDDLPTPLSYSIKIEAWKSATLLILWNANPSIPDNKGYTVIHYLAISSSKSPSSISILSWILRKSPELIGNIIKCNEKGIKTPFQLAMETNNTRFISLVQSLQLHHQLQLSSPLPPQSQQQSLSLSNLNHSHHHGSHSSSVGDTTTHHHHHHHHSTISNEDGLETGTRIERENNKNSTSFSGRSRRSFSKMKKHAKQLLYPIGGGSNNSRKGSSTSHNNTTEEDEDDNNNNNGNGNNNNDNNVSHLP